MNRIESAQGVRRGGLQVDTVLLLLVSAILLLGLVMVTSASVTLKSGAPYMYAKAQLLTALAGMLCALFLALVPTGLYLKFANLLLVIAAVLVVAVLIPGIGHEAKGGQRWIPLGFFNLQASEVVRVLVLCWIAAYTVRRAEELSTSLMGLVLPLTVTTVFCALLLLEPDFGAAAVLFATTFGLLFLAGARLRWVLLCAAVAGTAFAVLAVAAPYRLQRLLCFQDIWANFSGCGYQAANSLIAIGRGQWFGVGLGDSVQKLLYLPEAHNDFLFAVLAEELGLIGVVVTLALFMLLVWRVLYIARLAANAGLQFQAAIAAAFGLWVGIQSLINIGVNMGMLPTKGLTLPLMSYGRTSLMVTLGWLGLVLRVYHEAMTRTRGAASVAARREQTAEVEA